ncbi:hypothetical protein F4801DRAFT_276564 [Xylaria longipes]|nr:hypothetical protein F4801DRAFT_276564 [Xylaria longipes]
MSESDSTDLKGAADASMPQPPDKLEEKQSLWKHTTEVTKEITKKAIKIPKEVTMKMADDVLRWMFTTPTVLHPRQHPEWPGYTGIGTKLDFRLKTQVYDSRCLVDNTVASFYPTEGDRNLTPKQLIARPKIISLFKELQGRTQPFGTSDMNLFMRLLDDFFFAGAVVNKGRPRVFFRVWMSEKQYALHVTGAFLQHTLPWGVTRYRYIRGYGPVSEIHIAGSLVCYDPLPLWLLVQTLIHEMVHAYINLFLVSNSRNHFLLALPTFRARGLRFGTKECREASETLTNYAQDDEITNSEGSSASA